MSLYFGEVRSETVNKGSREISTSTTGTIIIIIRCNVSSLIQQLQPNQLHNLLCTLHTMSDYRLVDILNYESCQLYNHCFRYLYNMASISAKMINSKTVRGDR